MVDQSTLSHILKRYKERDYTLTKGFFEIAYVSNSPEVILETTASKPFIELEPETQKATIKSPILDGMYQMLEVEPGLWAIINDSWHKENANYKRVDDPNLPSDFYIFNLEISSGTDSSQKPILINGLPYSNAVWAFFKPGVMTTRSHFKNSRVQTVSLFFHKKWLYDTLLNEHILKGTKFIDFFTSKAKYLVWPEDTESAKIIFQEASSVFESASINHGLAALKKHMIELLRKFILTFEAISKEINPFEAPDHLRFKIIQSSFILKDNLYGPFMGVEKLASELEISASSLKKVFKAVFGTSIFNYFRAMQMDHAATLLQKQTHSIKDIAQSLGYENPSKFSKAFQKHQGVLPSKFID